jgi:hypothetical protein
MTPATDSISVSEPKARMPWTSSGRTTSSCGMCGITNERTLRLPRADRAGAPGGSVGSRLSTPFCSSTMIWRVRTGFTGKRLSDSRRP